MAILPWHYHEIFFVIYLSDSGCTLWYDHWNFLSMQLLSVKNSLSLSLSLSLSPKEREKKKTIIRTGVLFCGEKQKLMRISRAANCRLVPSQNLSRFTCVSMIINRRSISFSAVGFKSLGKLLRTFSQSYKFSLNRHLDPLKFDLFLL
jgi:hypothetical protein